MSSRRPEMVSWRWSFVSSPACGRNTAGMRGRRATPPVVQRPAKDKNPVIGASAGNQFGLSGGPGRGRGFHAPHRALPRLIRSRHQWPSRRGPARRRPMRPADRRHRGPSRQEAAIYGAGAPGHGAGGIRAGRRQGRLRLRLHHLRQPDCHSGAKSRRHHHDSRPARRHRPRLRDADIGHERNHGARGAHRVRSGLGRGPPDHRHTGAPNRCRWAATSRRSYRHRLPPASRPNSPADARSADAVLRAAHQRPVLISDPEFS